METVVLPVAACLLLTIGVGLCTYLFFTVKQELYGLGRQLRSRTEDAERTVTRLESEVAAMREALAELDRKTGQLPQLSPPKPGMNTTRRSQVLRMHRRGEKPEHIAAALGLPQGEVDLLLKVHEAVSA